MEFASGVKALLEGNPSLVLESPFDVIYFVDWSARRPFDTLRAFSPNARRVYLNFRVFSRGIGLDIADIPFYTEEEKQCVQSAEETIALCASDAAFLGRDHERKCKVVPCPLRHDMEKRAMNLVLPKFQDRQYITCCVRRAQEKNIDFFVDVLGQLSADFWDGPRKVRPLLCGAIVDKDYNNLVVTRILALCPAAIIIDDFLAPEALAEIFAQSLVNFHPALYEAFGLTMVEAAALGCPTIAHWDSRAGELQPIGALSLLRPDQAEIVVVDYEKGSDNTARELMKLVSEESLWTSVSKAGREKSISYTEEECAKKILAL